MSRTYRVGTEEPFHGHLGALDEFLDQSVAVQDQHFVAPAVSSQGLLCLHALLVELAEHLRRLEPVLDVLALRLRLSFHY